MDGKKVLHFREVDINDATDTMRCYLEIKNSHSDKIVLFQIGDFYETFFEDAKVLNELCNLVVSHKKYSKIGFVPMAGFPLSALNSFVKRLLDFNKRLVVVPQIKNLKTNVWERKISRIYTKGTIFEDYLLEAQNNNYICAVIKSGDQWGFSYCDVSVGSIFATSGTKVEILHELTKISPDEILVPDESLIAELSDNLEKKDIFTVLNKCFCFENKTSLSQASALAIENYLKFVQENLAPQLDEVKTYSTSEFLGMDFNTRRSLELSRTQADFKKRGSLFWFLDNTKTVMGRRTLKNWMNSPLTDKKEILKRQNLIKILFENKSLAKKIETFLEDLCDLLRLTSRISNKTINIKELIELSNSLKRVKKINEISTQLKTPDFKIDKQIAGILFDFSDIIQRTFDEDVEYSEIYPIKQGVDAALDYSRDVLSGCLNVVKRLEEEQKALTQEEKISTFYRPQLGYYFEISVNAQKLIPNFCFEKQRTKSVVRYTSPQLVEMEQKIGATRFAICQVEKEIFAKLREYCKELTFKIRDFANKIAYLDAIYSLYVCAKNNKFSIPEFNNDGKISIKGGVHPCVCALKGEFTPNDTNLDLNSNFLAVLTGVNASGKSTYLKQNAIIQVLAQMGSFVPANSASLPLLDKVFLHSVSVDSILKGTSTFQEEMKSIAFVLKSSTKESLILLDEPIKGTNPESSIKLCASLFEYISKNLKAKTIATTHFAQSCDLVKNCLGIEFLQIGEEGKNKISKGVSRNSSAYETAILAGVPDEIVKRAQAY